MGKGNHPVNVEIIIQDITAVNALSDLFDDCRRAIDAGQNADVIACPDTAIWAAVALKGLALGLGDEICWGCVHTVSVVTLEAFEVAIVDVDMLTGFNVASREADGLVEFSNSVPVSYRCRRHFVTSGNILHRRDAI